jgi:hypothetical protein
MRKILDLTGKRFGFLTVIEYTPRRCNSHNAQWICQCECGRYLIVRSDNLTTGHTTQCSICRGSGVRSVFVEGGVEDRDGVV